MRKNMAQKLDTRAFLRWNAIANKHVNFQERPGWVTLTLLSFVVLQSLTTGFTPNFTPQQITITKSQKTFQELDMSSDAFLQVYRPISPDVSCIGDLWCILESNHGAFFRFRVVMATTLSFRVRNLASRSR